MTGNTIFITGGTSGIGRGLAEAFHRLGNKVIIAGRRKALLDEVAAANPGIDGGELDISDLADIARVAPQLIRAYPALNGLVNSAGIMPFDDAADAIDEAATRRMIDTNLIGPILMTSALIAHLKAQPRATIIYNTSILAYVPLAATPVYSSTKAALHSYALSQRVLLRHTPVRLREIAPPWVDTNLIKKCGATRAMPLDAFIAETMKGLETDVEEVVVEAVRMLRDNPGSGEHRLVTDFNAAMEANPVPV